MNYTKLSSGLIAALLLAPGCKPDDVPSEAGADDAGTSGSASETGDTGDEGGDGDGDENYTPPPAGMRRLLDYQYVATIQYMFGPQAAVGDANVFARRQRIPALGPTNRWKNSARTTCADITSICWKSESSPTRRSFCASRRCGFFT